MRSFFTLFLVSYLMFSVFSCVRPIDPESLRGLSKEQLQQMREDILQKHADGSALSRVETANVELLREQERRLDNPWIFGEWRERHGARLIFRDDGSVSVGARGGVYDEVGIYKFISPEEPSFESTWSVVYDAAGDPVVVVLRKAGNLLYPFHRSRTDVYEQAGDLMTATETGFYFSKSQ
ncbi:MAG: hypothetical protein IKX34_02185 [Bacteroidales bacterium]|nr:hypothetical protein [Bacteroidales bacterium]